LSLAERFMTHTGIILNKEFVVSTGGDGLRNERP
jgi:hypothetical protein